mmetsp:Transcript_15139/g.44793  ORF Transcript_15139/g.44793 Transcript_15139/m.44793 type:complete len:121 (-) Transcript_15139:26-388(-)
MACQQNEKRLRVERDKLRTEVRHLRGQELTDMGLSDLEGLETELRESLARVTHEKEKMLRNQLDGEREHRLCVICQEEEKTCLLLPCRHLCLCKECSRRSELQNCPLCRKQILQKIDVYA